MHHVGDIIRLRNATEWDGFAKFGNCGIRVESSPLETASQHRCVYFVRTNCVHADTRMGMIHSHALSEGGKCRFGHAVERMIRPGP